MNFISLRLLLASVCFAALSACLPEGNETSQDTPADPPIRGLIATLVESAEEVTVRRYPGVLEPEEVSPRIPRTEVPGYLGTSSPFLARLVGTETGKMKFSESCQKGRF